MGGDVRHPDLRVVAVAFAVALTAACSDCGGDQPPPIPETAEARLEAYASALPAQTESALFVADIPALTAGASSLKRRIGEFLPGTNFAARQLKTLAGVDLFTEQGWSDVGIGTDGGAAVALVDGHPVVVAHVTDRRAFERRLTRLAERHYEIGGSVRRESADGLQMKVLRRSGAQVAWTYRDRMGVVVFPQLPMAPSSGPTVTNTLRALPALGSHDPLIDTTGFAAMRSDAGVGPNLWYARPEAVTPYLFGGGGLRAMATGFAVNMVLEPINGLGVAIGDVSDRIHASTWVGLSSELSEAVGTVASVEPTPIWSDAIGDGVLVAARAAIDPVAAWDRALEAVPEKTSRAWRRRLKRWRDRTGIDPKSVLLEPASGRILVAIRDIDRNFSLPAFVADPLGELETVDALLGVEFESEEAATSAETTLNGATDGETFFGLPLELRRIGARLLLTTGESSEDGKEAESGSKNDRPDLGQGIASVYVDGVALREKFENRLPPGNLASKLLQRFRGALVTLSQRGDGLVVEGEVTIEGK